MTREVRCVLNNREVGNKGDEVKPLFSSSHYKSHPQEYSIFTRSYNFYPFLVVLPSILQFFFPPLFSSTSFPLLLYIRRF